LNAALAKKRRLFGASMNWFARTADIVARFVPGVNLNADKFAALHAACWSGGMLLYVPKGVIIEEPLHSLAALSAAAWT